MVTIAKCPDLTDALRVRSMLEAYGVEAFLPDEAVAGLMPAIYLYPEGVRVQVNESEAEAARQLLADDGVEVVPAADACAEGTGGSTNSTRPLPGPAFI